MKKLSLFMIALIFLCLGGTARAAEWELGHESLFLFSERAALQLTMGVFGEDGSMRPQGWSRAEFFYLGEPSPSALQFHLSAEQYGTGHTRLSGDYGYSLNENLMLQVGFCWERANGIQDKVASLQGNWETGLGRVRLGAMGGTRDGAYLEYEGAVQLLDRLNLSARTGIRWEERDHQEQWTVPVGLTLTFDLADRWDLIFSASDAFPLHNVPDSQPLRLGVALRTTFDLRSTGTRQTERSGEAEDMDSVPVPMETAPEVALPPASDESAANTGPTESASRAEAPTGEETSVPAPVDGKTALPDSSGITGGEARQADETIGQENHYDPVTGILRLNGTEISVDAVIADGELFIPVRKTVGMLNGQIFWYPDSRQVSILLGDVKVLMMTRESQCMRNGDTVLLDDELRLWGGHYYIRAQRLIELLEVK